MLHYTWMVCWIANNTSLFPSNCFPTDRVISNWNRCSHVHTDQFTCYNKKRPSKGWPRVHLLHDNASSHKCEVVKSFFGFWKGESFKPSTLFTWPESLWLLFISKGLRKCFLEISVHLEVLLTALFNSVSNRYQKKTIYLLFATG